MSIKRRQTPSREATPREMTLATAMTPAMNVHAALCAEKGKYKKREKVRTLAKKRSSFLDGGTYLTG